ncbi:hypothetical protein [Anaerobiospirillum succiniciproducens]|uniref:hypothetical protein n=1 Tax=Anaerobiospirillum succiniciproducens TaxID=13335 RepID=UPI002943BE43|nr:hypothetical protein [Anaerobiospirillum succiniciproducens]
MAKKKPLLDNLKYIFCKDATNGKQAGFDVQLMRDRLTEIRYDIDHIQGDLDNIITGDLVIIQGAITDINNRIDAIIEDIKNFKNEFNAFVEHVKNEINRIDIEITQIKGRLDTLEQTVEHILKNYDHFEVGTQIVFYQSAAPRGWSIVQGLDDSVVTVNSVKAGNLAKGTGFDALFSSQYVGSTILDESQMPAHIHSISTAGSHKHKADITNQKHITAAALDGVGGPKWGLNGQKSLTPIAPRPGLYEDWSPLSSLGEAGSHTHYESVSGGDESHTHTLDLTVKHISTIVCRKEAPI